MYMFFFFKQKTAYEIKECDWSSDVCSSDLIHNSWADTVVTSCPGCIMQLEDLKRTTNTKINIMHMVEVVDEAMHG